MVELLNGVVASGHELLTYPGFWLRNVGLSERAGLAIEFTVLCRSLHMMVCYDQLNPGSLASAELITPSLADDSASCETQCQST